MKIDNKKLYDWFGVGPNKKWEAICKLEKRKILQVVIDTDSEIKYKNFNVNKSESRDDIIGLLLDSGLWPFLRQNPYDIIANPEDNPKAVEFEILMTDSSSLGTRIIGITGPKVSSNTNSLLGSTLSITIGGNNAPFLPG